MPSDLPVLFADKIPVSEISNPDILEVSSRAFLLKELAYSSAELNPASDQVLVDFSAT